MVGERALKASEALWPIEGAGESGGIDEAAYEAWHQRDERGELSALWQTLYSLPLLVLAVEAAATDPHATPSPTTAERYFWCYYEAERIAEVLSEWVTAHEKDAEPATTTKKNGSAADPVSQPEEPQEAEKRAHEADRLITTALDRLAVLAIDLKPFNDTSHRDIFVIGEKDTEDGWPTLNLTQLGNLALSRARGSAVDAARAARSLQYDLKPSAPKGWTNAIRQSLELTFVLVPALETLIRWEDVDGGSGDFFSAGEILTELVKSVKAAHEALALAYAEHSPFAKEASS